MTEPQWRAIDLCRISHRLHQSGHRSLGMLMAAANRVLFGVDIEPGAQIGARLTIRHGNGIVSGRGVTVGDDCLIFHQVTLGTAGDIENAPDDAYPTIGHRVKVFAGAMVLGPVTVGNDAVVAAGAIVTKDVPSGHLAIGVPATIKPIT
jgi:serine O-acetyltransferase